MYVGQWGNHLSAKADLFIAPRDIGNKRRETQARAKIADIRLSWINLYQTPFFISFTIKDFILSQRE